MQVFCFNLSESNVQCVTSIVEKGSLAEASKQKMRYVDKHIAQLIYTKTIGIASDFRDF